MPTQHQGLLYLSPILPARVTGTPQAHPSGQTHIPRKDQQHLVKEKKLQLSPVGKGCSRCLPVFPKGCATQAVTTVSWTSHHAADVGVTVLLLAGVKCNSHKAVNFCSLLMPPTVGSVWPGSPWLGDRQKSIFDLSFGGVPDISLFNTSIVFVYLQ